MLLSDVVHLHAIVSAHSASCIERVTQGIMGSRSPSHDDSIVEIATDEILIGSHLNDDKEDGEIVEQKDPVDTAHYLLRALHLLHNGCSWSILCRRLRTKYDEEDLKRGIAAMPQMFTFTDGSDVDDPTVWIA